MDGPALELSRRRAQRFAEDLLAAGQRADGVPRTVALGGEALHLALSRLDDLGELISGAFLPAPDRVATARLAVLRPHDLPVLPPLDWARPWITTTQEIPAVLAYPYRILVDRVVGIAYVLDQQTGEGVVWVRHEAELDLRSFITPFRVMMSWLANLRGAEVVHASGAVVDGRGVAFSGASGSGKSTVAVALGRAGHGIVADDCLWVEGGLLHAVYARAKVDRAAQDLLGVSDDELLRLPGAARAKGILSLHRLPGFQPSAPLQALAFPTLGSRPAWYALQPRRAHRMLARDSLREILGGRARNRLRLARLAREHPSGRVILSPSMTRNVATIEEMAATLGSSTRPRSDPDGL